MATARGYKSQALGKEVAVFYVDNPFHTYKLLQACFPTLGKGLFTGDCGVRWDMYHGINVMRDSCRGNHPLIKEAFEELVDKLTWVDDHGGHVGRKFIPPLMCCPKPSNNGQQVSTNRAGSHHKAPYLSVEPTLFDTFSKAIMCGSSMTHELSKLDGQLPPDGEV
eukprot:gene5599-2624_t